MEKKHLIIEAEIPAKLIKSESPEEMRKAVQAAVAMFGIKVTTVKVQDRED